MEADKEVRITTVDQVEDLRKWMQQAFSDPNIPKVYANSFKAGYSISDVYIILERNGTPDAVLNMSYTCAKSLQQSLSRVIAELEQKTNHTIMVIGDVKL